MRVVIDVEANGLINPTKIWVVVCKDIDTNEVHIFRNLTDDKDELSRFQTLYDRVTRVIGHNLLQYDLPVLHALGCITRVHNIQAITDTLVISRLVDYSRPKGHSIEAYGEDFGLEKIDIGPSVAGHNPFFNQWSQKMEDYCVRDVEICHRVYSKYLNVISSPYWVKAIGLEQSFQLVVNQLHNNGFAFNSGKASKLLDKVVAELNSLDGQILNAFPPREVLIREFVPRATKFGTINKSSVPRVLHGRIHTFEVGKTYRHTREEAFNPSSHKQLINVLHEAGWQPVDKTKTHIETERSLVQLKRGRSHDNELDLEELSVKMVGLEKFGWKINENNLSTLPATAPSPARLLAKRILYESRRRTLTEWLGLVQHDRIHGDFYGIGAWTQRMAHQKPNTANIPNAVKISDGSVTLLGKELRSLWQAPRNRLLVGVDAEAIQLRVFAHMINDKQLTNAIINGKKSDKTDPHSLNQQVFGSYCRTRNAAKHSLYAVFFGGRANKIAQIMGCSRPQAQEAIDNLIERYPGLGHLEREVFPLDAKRGWFTGLDGRKVRIPGDTVGERKHLCMSGYLQNGEAIIMKMATLKWIDKLKDYDSLLVNFVHDEWQTEVPNNMEIALLVAKLQADSLESCGRELGLNCPLAGSYYNEDIKDYTIGTNWSATH